MKIIIDDKIPFIKGVLEPFVDVVYKPGSNIVSDDLLDTEVLIIRTRTKCNKELLEGTKVKFIATATIGFDHIDKEYCEQNDIQWTNAPGCNSSSVKQWVLASLLEYASQKNIDLQKRTLGVVGVGHVGSKVVEVAENLGMRVVLNDPPREREEGRCGFVSLQSVLKESDIITFHVPLNNDGIDKTYHLVDDVFLSKVNPGTVILNSSRGEVVDNEAAKIAIELGQLQDVILDVWEGEPNINQDLMKKAFLATPHIAGYSFEGKANGTMHSVQAVSSFLGLPLDDWEPAELLYERTILELDASGKSYQEICRELISKTYSIADDAERLRENPASFEFLRGSYPIRHEPVFYSVKLRNGDNDTKKRLKELGFSIED